MKTLPDLLAQSPVFSHLKPQELDQLSELARSREYQKGEWIAHYGDVWPNLFLVENGVVTAVKESEDGRSLIIIALEPGEIFWGAAFFQEGATNLAALVAKEPCCIHLWSYERMKRYINTHAQISWELARLLVRRMQRASDIVEELAFQPVAGRLAKFLVNRFGESAGERVSRDLTLDEMAAHIGTTREMVCRILHRFAGQGAIEITRTEFRFTDIEQLKQLGQNLPD
jgi:CRP/FNR family transcriptional regulator, cyclic AMP receptor protein